MHLTRRAGKSGVARCGVRSIADVCRVSLETVVKTIRDLGSINVIACEKREKSTTRYRINEYTLWRPPDRPTKTKKIKATVTPNRTDHGNQVGSSVNNLLPNPEQIESNSCYSVPNGVLSKPEQSLLPKPERKAILKGNPKKASKGFGASNDSSSRSASATNSKAFVLSQETTFASHSEQVAFRSLNTWSISSLRSVRSFFTLWTSPS